MKPEKKKERRVMMALGITLVCASVLTGGIYAVSTHQEANGKVTTTNSSQAVEGKKKDIAKNIIDKNTTNNKKESVIDKVIQPKQTKEASSSLFEEVTSGNYKELSRDLIQKDILAFNDAVESKNKQPQVLVSNPTNTEKDNQTVTPLEPITPPYVEPEIPIEPDVPIEPEIPVVVTDYSSLESFVNEKSTIDLSSYLSLSIEHFSYEMLVSERILSDRNATQEQVNNELQRLEQAFSELVLKGDKSTLKETVQSAESIDKAYYTEDSYSHMTTVLTEAKAILTNEQVSQTQVDTANDQLKEALNQLVKVSESEEATINLKRLVESSETLESTGYTEASWTAFQSALTTAKDVLASEEPTTESLQSALSNLEQAKNSLEKIPDETETDKPTESETDKPSENGVSSETEKNQTEETMADTSKTDTTEEVTMTKDTTSIQKTLSAVETETTSQNELVNETEEATPKTQTLTTNDNTNTQEDSIIPSH